ncbi:MAG: DUF4339 domain-containing protein [Syntrophotaleaceae bacterium]
MWFYVDNEKQVGPIDESEIAVLVQEGAVSRATMVWREGMEDWTSAAQTDLAKLFKGSPPPVITRVAPASGRPVPAYYHNPDSLKTMWLWWAILSGVGLPLCLVVIGVPMVMASAVLGFILLYRWWESIQDGSPRTTPGKAVGFCFIPFYNFYWLFVAYVGLAKDMNVYCRERQIPATLDEGLALTYAILILTTFIPYLGFLTGIASLVVGIILFKKITETTILIIRAKQGQ